MVSILKHISSTNCQIAETVRYSSYGVPFGIPPGDIEDDGDCDNDDNMNWPGYSYDAHLDYDLDGDVEAIDVAFTITNYGKTLGRGALPGIAATPPQNVRIRAVRPVDRADNM